MRTIVRLQSSVGINGRPLDRDLISMYQQYKQVIFAYRSFRKTASTSRTTFRDERIEEHEMAGNIEVCAIRKNI